MPDAPSAPGWVDDAPVDPAWPAPAGPTPPARTPAARRMPVWAWYGIVLLALVVLVGGVWGLGGLSKRKDLLIETATGTTISTGPYEFTFTEVTAQRTKDFDETPYWKVTAIGTGRTTGSTTIAPTWSGDYGMFVSKDSASGEIETPDGLDFGHPDSETAAFTPGLAPVPFAVRFKYRESYQPGDTLIFGVFDLVYSDTSLLGDGDESWHNAATAHLYRLPVRVLADDL